MKIILDLARAEYSVMELIDLLAEQSAAIDHDAYKDRRSATVEFTQSFQDQVIQDGSMDRAPESAFLLPSVRRAREERLWSSRLFNGIDSRRLVARDAAGRPSRELTKLLDLFVTREALAVWLRTEGHVVELASTKKNRRRNGCSTGIAQDGGTEIVWEVKKSKRADKLATIIEYLLRAACNAGEPIPTARTIFERIIKIRPEGIYGVDVDEVQYVNHNGHIKSADIKAIHRRIKRAVVIKTRRTSCQ